MPFYFKKGDLVQTECDLIVNDSNSRLIMVEGVGRAIFHKAGDRELSNALKKIGGYKVGGAVLTPSFNMTNCKGLVHAVAPIYQNGKHGEEELLLSAYESCFKLMKEHGYTSIAFPLLGSEYNYTASECLEIAHTSILEHLKNYPNDLVYLVMFKNFPETISKSTQSELTSFILKNYTTEGTTALNEFVMNKELLYLMNSYIKKSKMSLEEIAIKANYTLEKLQEILTIDSLVTTNFIFALSIALKLSEKDIDAMFDIVESKNSLKTMTSLVVRYFIKKGQYDVYTINKALFIYNLSPIGL